jgi:DNA-binding NtrC family response regulator
MREAEKPMWKARLLIVDDDAGTLASLARAFRLAGHEAAVCDSAARALDILKGDSFDLIFSDVVMPGKDGLALLEELRAQGNTTPVVMMSGQAHIAMAVRATKLGALDFLEKPVSTEKLLVTVENTLRLQRLEHENRELRQRAGKQEIVFTGEAMGRVMAQVQRVAASETRVCILGETGTGKELVARAIHELSPRQHGPFVTLNCAAVPQELVESELFGHEKGAFTGAAARHAGKFEQAQRGTLFLDEIGDMPAPMQAKLLRVLEQSEIERVGGDRPVRVDVRIVVATHRRLETLVQEGKFRQDLYHRIYVFPVVLPPLRERRDDIATLIEHFAGQLARQNGWKQPAITPAAVQMLQQYSWPGNIRELRNVTERLLLLASDGTVDENLVSEVLPQAGASTAVVSPGATAAGTLAERIAALERATIAAELTRHNYNMAAAARALGLERSHLYKKCEQLGLDVQQERRRHEQHES